MEKGLGSRAKVSKLESPQSYLEYNPSFLSIYLSTPSASLGSSQDIHDLHRNKRVTPERMAMCALAFWLFDTLCSVIIANITALTSASYCWSAKQPSSLFSTSTASSSPRTVFGNLSLTMHWAKQSTNVLIISELSVPEINKHLLCSSLKLVIKCSFQMLLTQSS